MQLSEVVQLLIVRLNQRNIQIPNDPEPWHDLFWEVKGPWRYRVNGSRPHVENLDRLLNAFQHAAGNQNGSRYMHFMPGIIYHWYARYHYEQDVRTYVDRLMEKAPDIFNQVSVQEN